MQCREPESSQHAIKWTEEKCVHTPKSTKDCIELPVKEEMTCLEDKSTYDIYSQLVENWIQIHCDTYVTRTLCRPAHTSERNIYKIPGKDLPHLPQRYLTLATCTGRCWNSRFWNDSKPTLIYKWVDYFILPGVGLSLSKFVYEGAVMILAIINTLVLVIISGITIISILSYSVYH